MTAANLKEYRDYVEAVRLQQPELAAEVAGLQGLEGVLAWMEKRGLPPGSIDLFGQDEFEYDFLIQLEPQGRWLVFGVTLLGSLTAVAVWREKPSTQELLQRRLEEGWRPTPSRLITGPAILGHAACLLGQA